MVVVVDDVDVVVVIPVAVVVVVLVDRVVVVVDLVLEEDNPSFAHELPGPEYLGRQFIGSQ